MTATKTRNPLPRGRNLLVASGLAVAGLLLAGFLAGRLTADTSGFPSPGEYFPATSRPPGTFLTLRSTPHTSGHYLGYRLYGDPIEVACTVEGEPIVMNELNSSTWYRLSDGTFATANYVTVNNEWSVPSCGGPVPGPPTELRDSAIADAFFTPAGGDLLVHAAPDSGSLTERSLPYRARVTLACHTYGTVSTGVNGATELWYEIEGGGYVFDGFLQTGSVEPIVKECR